MTPNPHVEALTPRMTLGDGAFERWLGLDKAVREEPPGGSGVFSQTRGVGRAPGPLLPEDGEKGAVCEPERGASPESTGPVCSLQSREERTSLGSPVTRGLRHRCR